MGPVAMKIVVETGHRLAYGRMAPRRLLRGQHGALFRLGTVRNLKTIIFPSRDSTGMIHELVGTTKA